MTTAYTSLLGLALPVTGELSGTWGDTVNTAITSLLDTAVAGTTSITTDADITLTTTTGASNQARQAIILWNPASGTVTRNITAPAQSKIYVVINASGGTQSIVIRGVGPTTGVTIAKGESATVAWNGSDFVKVSSSGGAITFTDLTVTGNTILGDAAADTLTVNATSTFASPVNFTGQVKLPSTGRSAAAALTPTNPAFLYGVASTYTDTTSSGTLAPVASFYGLAQPTLSTSNVTTYTTAATLYIANAPAAGGSATITNPYALYSAAGANYFGGATTFNSTTQFNGVATYSANMLFSADNTYDIGASGATRPRDMFLGRNLTVGGTLTLAGGVNLNGNVTIGDSSADTLTVNSTITSNLIFTDNTYDIGADSATRPRTGYFGTNLVANRSVGIGMTPEAGLFSSMNFVRMSASTGGSIMSNPTSMRIGANWAFNSSGVDAYGGNGPATLYFQNGTDHRWYASPTNSSGALAVNPYENNMLLSRYGNLFVTNSGGTSSITATPWATSFSSVEVKGPGNGIESNGNGIGIVNNAYYDGSTWRYGYASNFATLQASSGNSTEWNGTVSTQGAGNAITFQTLMTLTMPAASQVTLSVGTGATQAADRNTILMNLGGFNNQPGNQTTSSSGDKIVLYQGVNRSAMGIGTDYNLWSQSKSFEWWISPTNSSSTLTQQLSLYYNSLNFGANDNTARYISVKYSTVPMYMSNSFDGTNGISTISNNIWNQSNGSYAWSSFANTSYGAAAIQLIAASGGNSYITMGAASQANTVPTGSVKVDKYGINAGSSSFTSNYSGAFFPNVLSNQNLFVDGSSNRVLALDSSATSGSMWLNLSTVPKYANDWDATAWRRWVNVSSTWYNAYNLLPESGLEREEYNPGFSYEVATGTSYSSSWQKITYDVSGGSRNLARDGVGYSTANGRFTAPCSGWYHFAAQITFSTINDTDGTIKFILNGDTGCYGPSSSQYGASSNSAQFPGSRQLSGTMYLTENDYVEVYCFFSGSPNVVRGTNPYAGSFSGHFVG